MTKIKKENVSGLDQAKKQLLKKAVGSCTSKIDFNKVREDFKYVTN